MRPYAENIFGCEKIHIAKRGDVLVFVESAKSDIVEMQDEEYKSLHC